MAEMTYEVELLDKKTHKFFAGVYNDFKAKAVDEYKFELEPLPYEEFIDAIEKDYMKCIVLKENEIPTAFLVYTTSISESIELNLIHCLGTEDEVTKVKQLIEKFLELTEEDRQNMVVSYPMIGHQSIFTSDITKFGFKFIGLAVLRFIIGNASSERVLENMRLNDKPDSYKIVGYSDSYKEDAVRIIHESFRDEQDALFDTRFTTMEGTEDIITKIVENVYGDFLPEATSVLLYNGSPVGFSFVNVTGGGIANIPLVAIEKEHRGQGFAGHLLNRSMKTVVDWNRIGKRSFTEINVTTETNNYKALKMYRKVGFKEDFCYPQAYLIQKKKK